MEIFAILSSTQSCIWYLLLRRKSKTGMRKQNILQLCQAFVLSGELHIYRENKDYFGPQKHFHLSRTQRWKG